MNALLARYRPTVRIITALYWLTILTLTHIPPQHMPNTHISDKIEHIGAYGLLGLLLGLCTPPRGWMIAILIAILLAYGAVDEMTQPYFHRTCDLYDWYADATGSIIAVISAVLLYPRLGLTNDRLRIR